MTLLNFSLTNSRQLSAALPRVRGATLWSQTLVARAFARAKTPTLGKIGKIGKAHAGSWNLGPRHG